MRDLRQLGFETILNEAGVTATQEVVLEVPKGALGGWLFVHVTENGTTTVDPKIQIKSPEGTWVDLPGASISQISGTGADQILIYPGVAETANAAVSSAFTPEIRVVFTVGGASANADIESYIAWLG